MATLARDLRSEKGPGHTLQHIVDAAVDLVGSCEVAGISLATRRGEISTSASTGPTATRNDELQQQVHEGPCVDAAWEERVVRVPDLAAEHRWQRWAPRAHDELGIGSMMCLQLFTHEDRLGELNLFSTSTDSFDEDDEHEAVAIAAHAAVALAAAENLEQLNNAIGNRTVIGQATGLTMYRYGISDDQAFNVLRRLSQERNVRLTKLAHQIVEDWNTSDRD